MQRPGIDLNADVGEGDAATDEALMQIVSSVNIACGGHAGDDDSMLAACRMAAELRLRIGAHPAYADRTNFGRVTVPMDCEDLVDCIVEQVERLRHIAGGAGTSVAYFKPHGALYNDAVRDVEIRRAIFSAAQMTFLPVMLLASALAPIPGILREGFIDRTYRRDGTLQPRSEPDALILDPGAAASQALELAPRVDSLCVHSDTPGALELAKAARAALEEAGYIIGP